jgi:SAM-dependent methyltransferase
VPRALGLDRDSELLRRHWALHRSAALDFGVADAHALPFGEGDWDVACSIEVLEQVDDPAMALRELARVARRHVLVSVPRDPIWRILNVARGAYLRSGGMPPGSVHQFASRSFVELCRTAGEPVAVATPFPWTMVLLRVG